MVKKQKEIITLGLLKKKLSNWVLSAHVVETLGLSSEDEAQIKKELIDLCDKGLVEKEGVRRGLKFRLKPGIEVEDDTEDIAEVPQEPVFEAGNMLAYVKQQRHDKDTLVTAGREFNDLLKYLLLTCHPGSDPSILSYTMSIKNTSDGISLRIYSGIVILFERTFTLDKFLKFIATSGVQFNAEPSTKSAKPVESKSELAKVV
jgi:hypothetical protein